MTLIRFTIQPPIKFQATQSGLAIGPRGYSAYEVYLAETTDDPPLTVEAWLLSLTGEAGTDGREIELQAGTTYIQWRFAGETEWNNIISIADLTGPQGIPGKEIQLQNTGSYIQWRYTDETWMNLIALTSLIGPQGPQGTEIELQVTATHIQWRYVDDVTWTNLVAIADITGPQGLQGIQGIPGTEIELQNTGTYIQWRYLGGAWSNLVALADITGPQGNSGSSYTLDFQTAAIIMSDINMEGAITITEITGLNVATLKLNNVLQVLGSGLSIPATNNQVLTWEITRTTTGYAALGIKFTRN